MAGTTGDIGRGALEGPEVGDEELPADGRREQDQESTNSICLLTMGESTGDHGPAAFAG